MSFNRIDFSLSTSDLQSVNLAAEIAGLPPAFFAKDATLRRALHVLAEHRQGKLGLEHEADLRRKAFEARAQDSFTAPGVRGEAPSAEGPQEEPA